MAQSPKSGSHIKGSVDEILNHYQNHYGNQRTKPKETIINKGLDKVTKGKNNTNPHNNKNVKSNRFDYNLSVKQNLSKRFNKINNKGKVPKPAHKNIKESKLNSVRKRKDTEGL